MRKLFFAALVDATLNRAGSFFSNIFLRRLAAHAAADEAVVIAAIEARRAQLEDEGRPVAAERLSRFLSDLNGDDPSYEASTCFARQLLADEYLDVDTPEMRGEPVVDERPAKRGRPKGTASKRLTDSRS